MDTTTPSVVPHHPRSWTQHRSFQDLMAEELRHAPWLGISILVHLLAGLILWQIPSISRPQQRGIVVHAVQDEPEEVLEEEEIEEKQEVSEEAEPEPVLQDSEVTPEETEEEEVFDETEQVDSNFDRNAFNDIVGIGGGAGGKFGGRGSGRRALRKKGGRPTAQAIQMGLEWLKNHQDPDGHWSAANFTGQCPPGDVCRGSGNAVNDIGITGLALLAFLGDGSTMRSGQYKDIVKRSTLWLRSQQEDTGLFGTESGRAFMYNHAIAALAFVESYGLSKYRTLRRYAQRAIDYIQKSRNPYRVWRYYPHDGENDSSVTGWMVFVLKSAQDFKLRVDADALEHSAQWFDEVTDRSTGQCGYTKKGEGSARERGMSTRFPASKTEALTAVGLLCRIFLGQNPETQPVLTVAADTLLRTPPRWDQNSGTIDLYYWYYASYAMFQMGGHHWTTWRKSLEKALVRSQQKGGHARGSWQPVSCWSHDGGRVYTTALATLCLEVYYRYTRLIR